MYLCTGCGKVKVLGKWEVIHHDWLEGDQIPKRTLCPDCSKVLLRNHRDERIEERKNIK